MAVARHAASAEGLAQPRAAEPAPVDLHTHTTRSDGVLEPAELVRQAADAGVRVLAVADHDTLAAVRELCGPGAAPSPAGLVLLAGIEINAVTAVADLPDGELHVLGYGMDLDDDAFEATLVRQRAARRVRFDATVERLRELGLPIDEQVAHLDLTRDDSLGRPTVARALVAAGHVTSVEDAFSRLLGHGLPGYVPRAGVGPVEAIAAIRAAGGVASLAHFPQAAQRRGLIRELVERGLAGLETHHRSFDDATRAALRAVALEEGLLETGGTDYHGDLGPYADSHAELVFPSELGLAAGRALGAEI